VAPLDDSRMQPFKEVHTVERFTIAVPIQNSNEDPPKPNTSLNQRAYDADDRQNIKSLLDNLVYILQQTLDSLHDLVPAVRSDLGADMLQEVQPKLAKAHAVLAKTLQSATIEIPKV
jgi:hypothetical protein